MNHLRSVDRITAHSNLNFGVAARYGAVEKLLDNVWDLAIRPLLHAIGHADQLKLRVPASLIRLPLTTARCARSGQSLLHITEPSLVWPGNVRGEGDGTEHLVRIDGHFREVADQVARLELDAGATVLLMGCRTAELIPSLARAGAAKAIVTSWDVEDRHCAPFADQLEERIRSGLSAAAALRSVQALRSSGHPYEWAGYSLVDFCAQERLS